MDAYIGEIRLMAGVKLPNGWLYCDGSLIRVNDYQALYSLLGTTYGGDGTTNFGLPDLRGRLPVGQGQGTNLTNRVQGQQGGAEFVTVDASAMPNHNHAFTVVNTPAAGIAAANQYYAAPQNGFLGYMNAAGTAMTLHPNSVINAGGGQPHGNIMPSLVINYMICWLGTYPTPN